MVGVEKIEQKVGRVIQARIRIIVETARIK